MTTKNKDNGFLHFVIILLAAVIVLLKLHYEKQVDIARNLGYNEGFSAAIQCTDRFPETNNEATELSKCFNNKR